MARSHWPSAVASIALPKNNPFTRQDDPSTSAAMDILPDSSQATMLTLVQIQDIARRENPTFKEFAANHAAAQAEVLQAMAVLNTLAGRALPPRYVLADTLEQPLNGVDLAQARQIALAQYPTLRRLDAVLRQRELAIGRERTAWRR